MPLIKFSSINKIFYTLKCGWGKGKTLIYMYYFSESMIDKKSILGRNEIPLGKTQIFEFCFKWAIAYP